VEQLARNGGLVLQIVLAALHLLALALGFTAVLTRGLTLREVARGSGGEALRRAFHADSHWGLAGALWIGTGLWRWLAGIEKSAEYYNRNHLFLAKMGVLAIVLALEIWPMVTLVRWRIASRRAPAAEPIAPPAAARRIAALSFVQAVLVVVMVFLAAAMARGVGVLPGG
jgi:putative membrane protein